MKEKYVLADIEVKGEFSVENEIGHDVNRISGYFNLIDIISIIRDNDIKPGRIFSDEELYDAVENFNN
jgi:hypothetical protein